MEWLGGVLGASWGNLGASWAFLKVFWPSWRGLVGILGGTKGILEGFWSLLETFWCHLGASLEPQGRPRHRFERVWGRFCEVFWWFFEVTNEI